MIPDPASSALRRHAAQLPLAVGFSGGADSTALLHAATAVWPRQVHAIHVHHGLQAAADSFMAHCQAECDALQVPLHTVRVDAGHRRGESPEDAARTARYDALTDGALLHGLREVLLAHHADDQVETLLLALSRGAGVAGLAAMPVQFERRGVRFVRPLLGVPGPALRQWLLQAGIAWVEDPTNADPQRTRNRIRHAILPALENAFPQFRQTFGRSARHAAEASELLSELAQSDLLQMGGEPLITQLQELPRSRQANLLRQWLRSRHSAQASTAQADELLAQIDACRTRGHCIRLKVADGLVERDGDRLAFSRSL